MDEPHSPGSAARPRASTSTRTRRAGSRNLKTDEWVLLYQHSILRTKERKETGFLIYGQKYRDKDVSRKMRRAINKSDKALLKDLKSLPPLPGHLELRTPSPEPTPLPPIVSARSITSTEHSSQRQEANVTDTVQQSSHASPESEASSLETDAESDPLWDFLSQLPLSKFVLDFCIPDWKPSSRVFIYTGAGLIEARKEDSLVTFLDRLNALRAENGDYLLRLSNLELAHTVFSDHGDHFSFSHFWETVVSALDETTDVYETLSGVFENFDDLYIKAHTARALGAAAYRNNFKAVHCLLDWEDADINGTVSMPHPHPKCDCELSIMAYCRLLRFSHKGQGPSDEMIAYLLGRGARPTRVEKGLMGLLNCLLRQRDLEPETFLPKVQSVVECIPGFADSICETENILETCVLQEIIPSEQRLQAFEFLLDRGAKTTPGSPLAALIYIGGPPGLVEKVLKRTADVNAYCDCVGPVDVIANRARIINSLSPLQAAAMRRRYDLVDLLLKSRADVNCPARGSGGVTPLQGACFPKFHMPYKSIESFETKIRIVRLLLDRGANVNAAPAWNMGLTALQAAAFAGQMELVRLLISRGANVNAPACKYGGGTAVAMAARGKHLDIVLYLLIEGAAIPAANPKVGASPVSYDDRKIVMDLLRDGAPESMRLYATRLAHSRDYREYEAEWAKDPTYGKGLS